MDKNIGMKKILATLLVATANLNDYVETPISTRRIENTIKKKKQHVYCYKCGIELDKEFTHMNNKKVCLACKKHYAVKREKKEKKPQVKIVYKKKKGE